MRLLIILIISGSLLAYFAIQNPAPVTVNLAQFTISNVPLFYVIIGSILVGLLIGYLISLIKALTVNFALRGKNKKLADVEKEKVQLVRQVHQLELENEQLKKDAGITDDKSL